MSEVDGHRALLVECDMSADDRLRLMTAYKSYVVTVLFTTASLQYGAISGEDEEQRVEHIDERKTNPDTLP